MKFYIERSEARGRPVIAAWSDPQYPTQAFLPSNDAALQAYLQRSELSKRLSDIGVTVDDVASLFCRVGRYVDRDGTGVIVHAWTSPQRERHEFLPIDHPGLQRFLDGVNVEGGPPPPAGYAYEFVQGKGWRIVRLSDKAEIFGGFPTVEEAHAVAVSKIGVAA